MGIIWRVAMVLMSTLAALVIIVHSAEDDLDTERRYDLRPRTLDTGTLNFDQPWRAMEAEPVAHQSTQADMWHDSLEETPKRRRPVRKRKRRPLPAEDLVPQERQTYPEESPRYHEQESNTPQIHQDTTDTPRRRRKKPENRRNRWTEEYVDTERSLRRRGQRRKRPSIDTWPLLSEFNEFRPDESKPEVVRTEQTDPFNIEDNEKKEFDQGDWFIEPREVNMPQSELNDPIIEATLDVQGDKVHIKDDKSLSEFSMEILPPIHNENLTDEEVKKLSLKLKEKSSTMNEFYKAQDNGPIDPVALKEILKRSNGTSLSEILQQHNLSLADLLHGRENAISVLKTDDSLENQQYRQTSIDKPQQVSENLENKVKNETNVNEKITPDDKTNLESMKPITETTTEAVHNNHNETSTDKHSRDLQETLEVKENAPKLVPKRRFPGAIRRKLRMRPMLNATSKGQLNRELLALTARRYSQHNRGNSSKSRDWKTPSPSVVNTTDLNDENSRKEVTEAITTTIIPEESTTIIQTTEYTNPSTVSIDVQNDDKTEQEIETVDTETTQASISTTVESLTTEINATEKPKSSRITRPTANRMGLRRQEFNNRLKKKRLKQKNSTTEPPVEQDHFMEDLFGMPNLVSSSEFIARTQTPSKSQDDEEDFTTLDDFITTEASTRTENTERSTKPSSTTHAETVASTTEETAKIEIEEILNDTRTSARLSRILMERNMTLTELVEHRERGSSHVHLADIFHNASKEPNPPEPFLSKSLIEPISKEIYPLRAILEANRGDLHDPTAKVTKIDPAQMQAQLVNIPVVMDFGNNVNENGENMGIMSLFNKIAGSDTRIENTSIQKDSEGVPYVTTVININTSNSTENARESRTLKEESDNIKPDIMSWNELFDLMRRNHHNETEVSNSLAIDLSPIEANKKVVFEEDRDGDGLIVLEDLQHLKDFDNHIASASEEKLEVNTYERVDIPTRESGILTHIPSNTRSVTVATASIVGLAMILFLLTYAAFKWKQQRRMIRKKQSFTDERIPTPVFENRKGHKNNCSTRSISPMLAQSNIYTLNTLESHNGTESPDYMWDSLRKPFQ